MKFSQNQKSTVIANIIFDGKNMYLSGMENVFQKCY